MAKVFAVAVVLCIVGIFKAIPTNSLLHEPAALAGKDICLYLPLGTTILEPKTCSKWLKCSESADHREQFEEGSCVTGLYFDRNSGKCDYDSNVVCPYAENQDNSNRCAKEKNGVYLADPTNCNAYIYCQNNREMYSNCPSNMVFQPVTQACVYESSYKCPIVAETVHTHPICRSLPDKMTFADDEDCTKYNKCENGELKALTCKAEQAYDYLKGKCVNSTAVECYPSAKAPEPESTICVADDATARVGYVSDKETCSGYYYCSSSNNTKPDRHPTYYTCPNGQFFHEQSWTCRDRLNVPCSLDRCEGVHQKYVNVASDCRAYAYCVNGATFSNGNCTGDLYFDERTQGCVYNKIEYAACFA